MKKPTIRVTKWLGNIPAEAACSVPWRSSGQWVPAIDLTAKSFRSLSRSGLTSTVRRYTRKNNEQERERTSSALAGNDPVHHEFLSFSSGAKLRYLAMSNDHEFHV
jgi:hypothetical protein